MPITRIWRATLLWRYRVRKALEGYSFGEQPGNRKTVRASPPDASMAPLSKFSWPVAQVCRAGQACGSILIRMGKKDMIGKRAKPC